MRMARIEIKNFRNFRHLDLQIGRHAVIVGENKIATLKFPTFGGQSESGVNSEN